MREYPNRTIINDAIDKLSKSETADPKMQAAAIAALLWTVGRLSLDELVRKLEAAE